MVKESECFVFTLFNKKAAPRFELGVRVLQTPALPLGYAAERIMSITN